MDVSQKIVLISLILLFSGINGINQAKAIEYYCEKTILYEGLLTLELKE